MIFKVALLQLTPCDTIEENKLKGFEYCKKAKALGADIALFPEMWSVGYKYDWEADKLKNAGVSESGSFVSAFSALAKELDMAIGITYLEKYEPYPRNTLTVFDRFGNKVMTYAKLHTCVFSDDEKLITPGDDFYTADLNTSGGNVKIGAMICYDREFPESARILMLKGVEIILVPNACPMEINRLSQLRARAYENMLGIATANYPSTQYDCNGHSTAFDGIAYLNMGNGNFKSRDTLIAEAGEGEEILIAEFNLDDIRDYRGREVHGNAYRHPDKYGLLIDKHVSAPFVRADSRR